MIVDSSVWLEIFTEGRLSTKCEKAMRSAKPLIPTLILFEVYKKLSKKFPEEAALEVVSYLSQFSILDLNREIALLAADISIEKQLPMADSMVLAFAQSYNVPLLTLDNDFSSIENVLIVR